VSQDTLREPMVNRNRGRISGPGSALPLGTSVLQRVYCASATIDPALRVTEKRER